MNTGRLLGIDHGIKRVGLAVSDFTWRVARELMVLKRKSREEDFTRLRHIVVEQKIVAFVVGLPQNLEATEGKHTQADTVRLWATRLMDAIPEVPIVFWDEQLSSIEAKELAEQKKRHYRDPIDDLAARIILQRYMDALCDGSASSPLHSCE